MNLEQRKESRKIVSKQLQDKLQGKLQILLGEQCLDILSVKDTSPFGIRLEIGRPVAVGENLLLRYFDEQVDLKLNGTVMWNRNVSGSMDNATGSRNHLIGIRLASPSLLHVFC
jgi:hypothetical protein